MIELQQLLNLNLEQVVNLLLEQKTQPFEIYIPKETQLFNSDREAISIDYCNLAYAGQLLFDASDEFKYEEVSPDLHESVCFTISAKDFEKLAVALLEISYGYVNDHPEDEEYSFDMEVAEYMYEVKQGKIKKIACPYFVEISKEFGKEKNSEND
jgi:hypothetical protein